MYSCEVLIFDEYRAVCMGKWDESEWTLEVVAGRGVVEVDGVGVNYVGAGCCSGVNVIVELAGVEGGRRSNCRWRGRCGRRQPAEVRALGASGA